MNPLFLVIAAVLFVVGVVLAVTRIGAERWVGIAVAVVGLFIGLFELGIH